MNIDQTHRRFLLTVYLMGAASCASSRGTINADRRVDADQTTEATTLRCVENDPTLIDCSCSPTSNDQAQKLMNRGVELGNLQVWREARTCFESAYRYELSQRGPTAVPLNRMVEASYRLRDYTRAARDLNLYYQNRTQEVDDEPVLQSVAEAITQRVSRIRVVTDAPPPSGVEFFVDGTLVEVNEDIFLEAGRAHRLSARGSRRVPYTIQFTPSIPNGGNIHPRSTPFMETAPIPERIPIASRPETWIIVGSVAAVLAGLGYFFRNEIGDALHTRSPGPTTPRYAPEERDGVLNAGRIGTH